MTRGAIYQPILSPCAMPSENSTNFGKMTMASVNLALTTRKWPVPVKPFYQKSRILDELKRKASTELNEVDRYINDGFGVLEDLNHFPTIKQIFM